MASVKAPSAVQPLEAIAQEVLRQASQTQSHPSSNRFVRDGELCFLRLPKVKSRVALSRSEIYRKIAAGEFPRPYNLGARAVAWLETDIDTWIEARIKAHSGTVKPVRELKTESAPSAN